MNVTFENREDHLVIKDAAKKQNLILYFVLFINLANSILFISASKKAITYWLSTVWIIVGSISIFGLFFLFYKRSSQSTIPKQNIKTIGIVRKANAKQLKIHLTNRKVRIVSFKNEEHLEAAINELKNLAYEIN